MSSYGTPAYERFETRSGAGPVELYAAGLRHPRSTWLGGERFTAWEDVLHLAIGALGLRLATRGGVFLLRRSGFVERDGPEQLASAILTRLAALPGGDARIARMRALDARARNPARTPVTRAVIALCLAVYVLQVVRSPSVELAGMFSAPLVSLGELWRLVTANFLHGSAFHLLINAIGLFVLGTLVERSQGSAGALLVMGLAAAGAMFGSWLAAYPWAVGASGMVAGLAGALLWLELRRPATLPAGWRIPRRIFIGAILGETLLLLFVPGIAHAAHAGGFAAGALAGALADARSRQTARRRRALVWADAVLVALMLVAGAAFAQAVFAPMGATLERRADALLRLPGVHPLVLNNEAWRIAVAGDADPRALAAATRLAERAVEVTERDDPNVLDTLAEVHFAAGRSDDAVRVIDEAIALAPNVDYFREQRRRFRGERPADDRPDPPEGPVEPLRLPEPIAPAVPV